MDLEKKTQLPRPGRSNLCVRVYRPVPYSVPLMDHSAPLFLFESETTTTHAVPLFRFEPETTTAFRFEPETTTATRLLRVRFHDGLLQYGKQVSLSVELGFVSTN